MPKTKIIVDTHYLIWDLMGHTNINSKVEKVLSNPENELYLCAISYWEIAMLVGKKKIQLLESVEMVCNDIQRLRNYKVINISPKISEIVCLYANQINSDPADCIIAASTIANDAFLLTRDQNLIKASFLKTLWLCLQIRINLEYINFIGIILF